MTPAKTICAIHFPVSYRAHTMRTRSWKFQSLHMNLILLMTMNSFLGSTMADSNSCNDSSLPSPPPVSELIVFLQKLQDAGFLSFGNNASFDAKTYVDLPLRFSLQRTSSTFDNLPRSSDGSISAETLTKFIDEYFFEVGSDLVKHIPVDYEAEPANFIPNVKDKRLRSWALKLHAIWLELARKVAENVEDEPDQHTLLPLPNPFVVPGSRFREVYYWDSYWIIRGLLVSKMFQTAKGMIENLLSLVKVYGFVLNGARLYYENRSQPPLLSAMVREVYVATNDTELLQKALPILVEEHSYWTSGPKQVTILDGSGHEHTLSRYYANWKAPRPESYINDVQIAAGVSVNKQEALYHDIATAAESGWDFGSRWLRDEENLSTLFTSWILPADLNAYVFQMESNIAYFAKVLGVKSAVRKFGRAAKARQIAMDSIMWNDDMGQWFDYVLDSYHCKVYLNKTIYLWNERGQRIITSISNFVPLWGGILKPGDARTEKVVNALIKSRLLFPAGLATSLQETGQQWDFPNAWPPLQHMVIEGLFLSGHSDGQRLAKKIALEWIRTNFVAFNESGYMLEKYDATVCGGTGGGGEYELQTGFGWTNGVVLSLLNDLELTLEDPIVCSYLFLKD
ncbi:hypothetical protein KP509_16G076300 [Ceratopteris richardii]|uniref:Trehalase n=1 Tax=Ceratopteris richardii TaxID=49495 RepID=A0A8T2T0V4_CERRI|nr:hypothetical protein KP509_16G076300 [Ceratopteris richardii]